MELPQSRTFGNTQARKATHDFLSLNSHSSVRQDPNPRPSHGDTLKTHDFLQPLVGEQKNCAKEDNAVDINVKSPSFGPPTSIVEHLLPGGIGTYSISRLPCITHKVPKPEENGLPVISVASSDRNDDNSCSSYTGGSFMLWDESANKEGHLGKENSGDKNLVKASKVVHWPLDRPSQSSSNHRRSISPLSSSQVLTQKNHSFMEMLKSAKGSHSMEEENDEDLSIKKESSSSLIGELRVKVDGKNNDQKANTPRSKHSATEQRRRCKINDRFQALRELIPHSEQKRDKASFLLEVIEYIQFLQEKVNRYEGSYPGWNSEPSKLIPWSNNHVPNESFVDQPRAANGITNPVLMFGANSAKLEEKATSILNIHRNSPQAQAGCKMPNLVDFKTVGQQSEMSSKTGTISSSMQPDIYPTFRSSCAVAQPPARIHDGGNVNASFPDLQLWQSRTLECEPSVAGVKLNDQGLAVEGGTINISSIYSQGLLNTLTRALQNSGVDLSQASIAVQVDIGKRANNRQYATDQMAKNVEAPCNSQSPLRGRVESINNESDHAVKRLKTG